MILDYTDLLSNKIVFITGVARSGTSILGKIIGSAKYCYYLFEPYIFHILSPNNPCFTCLFFEDYVAPLLQGRHQNLNTQDHSFYGNYLDPDSRTWSMDHTKRVDLIHDFKESPIKIVIKLTEGRRIINAVHASDVFGKIKVLEIIRNGNDVIGSSMRLGWYTDKYLHLHPASRWLGTHYKDPISRAAIGWRYEVNTIKLDLSLTSHIIKYETLLLDPANIALTALNFLNVKPTSLTYKHINAIRNYNSTKYKDYIPHINPKERKQFIISMKKLGYIS